jgi:rhodanese-related sulfurtransferase
MKTFTQLVKEASENVAEVFPWDIGERFPSQDLLIVDVREPYEYDAMHIADSLNVPRGILETACEYNFEETVPELVTAREKHIILVCRSGNRSIFAAEVMQQMGYQHVYSLKTGLRGWADNELPLFDNDNNPVDIDAAEAYFLPQVRPDQIAKKS